MNQGVDQLRPAHDLHEISPFTGGAYEDTRAQHGRENRADFFRNRGFFMIRIKAIKSSETAVTPSPPPKARCLSDGNFRAIIFAINEAFHETRPEMS